MQSRKSLLLLLLPAGDVIVFVLVTMAGFARHGELAGSGLRPFTTFIPLCLAWALASPWLGVYDVRHNRDWRQLWRPLLAMVLAAPLAAWLRGLWLGEAVPVVFVAVIAAFCGLGLLVWRSLWALVYRPRQGARRSAEGQAQGEARNG